MSKAKRNKSSGRHRPDAKAERRTCRGEGSILPSMAENAPMTKESLTTLAGRSRLLHRRDEQRVKEDNDGNRGSHAEKPIRSTQYTDQASGYRKMLQNTLGKSKGYNTTA